ncbi:hypothetical protein H257_14845 [Aphanomyces astaci]|uniref:Uncharacterized protein n=1 Tax=Aphanomyces astaci TaxID=112090 RepID=W4FPT5_APHAT|nr:hypothetical protein H257_14845 [Aphanomyces astaci]ETV69475.1 hypothetical protein H257_14845 [Aphanomyces astaci]|eukprot:XP_009841048.1 hypothetical protein H257_14845 [Aphanomyces astaci]
MADGEAATGPHEQLHATAISVYQRLHSFKFRPHASLDVNLQAIDKLRTEVENLLEGHPLSDSHLASALLKVLPTCIMQDYYMWPSIPYQDMRRLLEKHRPDVTLKYPSILGPASIALTVPVHGSATATAITRSRALALPAFRAGSRHRDGYGQAGAPLDVHLYKAFPGVARTRCVKTLCFHQDGLPSHLANTPQVVAVDALKADQAATAVANATSNAAGVVEES